MRGKILITILIIVAKNVILFAQNGTIQLDRPDQTESPFIVPKGYLQVESGFDIENNEDHKIWAYPTILWKYGINKKLELRLVSEYTKVTNEIENIKGINPITVGFKVNLFEAKNVIPQTSFIGHLTLPNLASKHLKSSEIAPSFRFTMQNNLTNNLSIGYNLGAEWEDLNTKPTYIYTLTAGYSITDKLGSYIELYGFTKRKSKTDNRVDGGFTYLFSNNIIADISGGIGLVNSQLNKYISLGFSFRIDIKK